MGFWKVLLNRNNAEGTRELARITYEQGLKFYQRGIREIPIAHPHIYALFHTAKNNEPGKLDQIMSQQIFAEIAPFMIMKQDIAIKAYAEYEVLKIFPNDCDSIWLKDVVSKAVKVASKGIQNELVTLGFSNAIGWFPLWYLSLIDEELRESVKATYRTSTSLAQ